MINIKHRESDIPITSDRKQFVAVTSAFYILDICEKCFSQGVFFQLMSHTALYAE